MIICESKEIGNCEVKSNGNSFLQWTFSWKALLDVIIFVNITRAIIISQHLNFKWEQSQSKRKTQIFNDDKFWCEQLFSFEFEVSRGWMKMFMQMHMLRMLGYSSLILKTETPKTSPVKHQFSSCLSNKLEANRSNDKADAWLRMRSHFNKPTFHLLVAAERWRQLWENSCENPYTRARAFSSAEVHIRTLIRHESFYM